MVTQVAGYHGMEAAVVSFDFSIRLGTVRRGEDIADVQDFAKILKEIGGKASSVVGDEFFRSSFVGDPLIQTVLDHLGF